VEEVRHLSISIARRPNDVYEFASDPRNLPRWATGLARSTVTKAGDAWIAEAPFGRVKIRFAAKNAFGVMDHDVELESGAAVHNPMRVVPNGEGSEFIFTLFRRPGMSDPQFAEDKLTVEKDLRKLKELLESNGDAEARGNLRAVTDSVAQQRHPAEGPGRHR
jgi:Polyketide cyclase / dehydrase and lipid transport